MPIKYIITKIKANLLKYYQYMLLFRQIVTKRFFDRQNNRTHPTESGRRIDMSNRFEMTTKQAHEIATAFQRNDWTDREVRQLAEGTLLADVLRVVKGHAFIETKGLVIDCDADPYIPEEGWAVEQHQKGGILQWNDVVQIVANSRPGNKHGTCSMESVRVSLNANVLFHLLENQHLIPEEWRETRIIFNGTTYRHNYSLGDDVSDFCVCYLHELTGGGWSWDWFFV